MKILQEDVILSVKAVWCTKAIEWISQQGLETWKHRQSAENNPQDGYFVWQPGSGSPRFSYNFGGPCAQWRGQAKQAPITDNSPRSPAQLLQTTSCSAVVWSQSHLPSHSL